jgi:hypothetical protein
MIDGGVKRFGSGWSWLVWDGTASPSTRRRTRTRRSCRATCRCSDRRLGARLLPQVPEQASRLPRAWWNVVNWPEVERRSPSAELERVAQPLGAQSAEARMRKNSGDMEIALEVPSPRCAQSLRNPRRAADDSRPTRSCWRASASATAKPSRSSTAATSARSSASRCGGSGPWPRRGRRPGGVRGDLALSLDVPAERGAAGGWLYTVARNAIVDRCAATDPRRPPSCPSSRPPSAGPRSGPRTRRRVARAPRPRGAPAAGARGDRARVLERHVPERGGRVPPPPAWNR